MVESFNDFTEGDVLADITDFNLHTLTGLGIWNGDNIASFNTGDSIPLLPDILDLNNTALTIFKGGPSSA